MKHLIKAAESKILDFGLKIAGIAFLALIAWTVTTACGEIKGAILQTYSNEAGIVANTDEIKIIKVWVQDSEGRFECIEKVIKTNHPAANL